MEYKIHQYRFDNFTRYENIIREAMNALGYVESEDPDINIYNHCHYTELDTDNNIIFKPTAPSTKYFAIDRLGYASASLLSFQEPEVYEMPDSNTIKNLIKNKSNKWDESILLKWRSPKKIPKDHILVIGQMPDDESVTRHSFGNHIEKINSILKELKEENVLLKLHPRYKAPKKLLEKWKDYGIEILSGYYSIHDVLPHTKVAILENSTAGIECMMHNVPIISYGYPEYHWATYKLQSLTELKAVINNIGWYDEDYANSFIKWYIDYYLCHDVRTTMRRLENVI